MRENQKGTIPGSPKEEACLGAEVVEVGRRLEAKGLVIANDGNISVRLTDQRILTTPTGCSKGSLQVADLVVTDLQGQVLAGLGQASSELKLHLKIYAENPQLQAVVHGHPPIATAFGVAGIPLNKGLLTEAAVALGVIPVAPYGAPSTQALADSIAGLPQLYHGAILANHGAVAWGTTLEEAFFRLERIEYLAKITLLTEFILGKSNLLGEEQLDHLLELRQKMGILTGGRPTGVKLPKNMALRL